MPVDAVWIHVRLAALPLLLIPFRMSHHTHTAGRNHARRKARLPLPTHVVLPGVLIVVGLVVSMALWLPRAQVETGWCCLAAAGQCMSGYTVVACGADEGIAFSRDQGQCVRVCASQPSNARATNR